MLWLTVLDIRELTEKHTVNMKCKGRTTKGGMLLFQKSEGKVET